MQQLSDDLSAAQTTLDDLGRLSEIDNQQTILEILQRCPECVQSKWHKLALDQNEIKGSYPGFADLVNFVSKLAKKWNDPVYGKEAVKAFKHSQGKTVSSHNVYAEVRSVGFSEADPSAEIRFPRQVSPVTTSPCIICHKSHKLIQCEKFHVMKPSDRIHLAKRHRLCFNCLAPNHIVRNCKRQSVCPVPNCGRKYSKFLHLVKDKQTVDNSVNAEVTVSPSPAADSETESHSYAASSARGRTVYLPTVAIMVNGVRAYAMLDSCSTDSVVTESLASRLNLTGKTCNYVLNTMAGSEKRHSCVVEAEIGSIDRNFVQVVNNLMVVPTVPSKGADKHIDVQNYPHLCDISLSPVPVGAQVDLLIGQNNPNLILPRDVRFNHECPSEPYATKSVFGWCLNGFVGNKDDIKEISSHFVQTDPNLERLWRIEVSDFDESGLSIEDQKVLSLWDNKIERIDGHYYLPIPWRRGKAEFPNNRALACHRLHGLDKRLNKQGLRDVYDENVKVMFTKGYAEPVPKSELSLNDGTVWYLPHHPVLNKKGKVRPVFDCAAKYKGVSLNSQCYQGPDLVNKLIGVLLRFRQFKYAITADIEAMYLQVKIPEIDRNSLRFLWYESDGSVTEYRMSAHLFGGVWSGSSSAYALRRTVADCSPSPLIADTILNSFYVDELLKSVNSLHDARRVIHDTKKVVSYGGFNLTKYTVNDNELLQEIDMNDRAGGVKEIAPETFSKSLGLEWEVSSDTFRYTSKAGNVNGPVTGRQMLSFVSLLYDPLGLISPIVVQGKCCFKKPLLSS